MLSQHRGAQCTCGRRQRAHWQQKKHCAAGWAHVDGNPTVLGTTAMCHVMIQGRQSQFGSLNPEALPDARCSCCSPGRRWRQTAGSWRTTCRRSPRGRRRRCWTRRWWASRTGRPQKRPASLRCPCRGPGTPPRRQSRACRCGGRHTADSEQLDPKTDCLPLVAFAFEQRQYRMARLMQAASMVLIA